MSLYNVYNEVASTQLWCFHHLSHQSSFVTQNYIYIYTLIRNWLKCHSIEIYSPCFLIALLILCAASSTLSIASPWVHLHPKREPRVMMQQSLAVLSLFATTKISSNHHTLVTQSIFGSTIKIQILNIVSECSNLGRARDKRMPYWGS